MMAVQGTAAPRGADQFTWSAKRRFAFADASDLGFPAGHVPAELVIRNEKTSAVSTFRLMRADQAGEEIAGWVYRGVSPATVRDWMLEVYND